MSTKYSCDICGKELQLAKGVHIMGTSAEITDFCPECWVEVEKMLLKMKKAFKALPISE